MPVAARAGGIDPDAGLSSSSQAPGRWNQSSTVVDTMTSKKPALKKTPDHQHTPEEERRIREAALDQTVEGSFPASDPPSSNPNPDDHEAFERAKRRRGAGGKVS
jgi:hypothetical protein